MRRATTSVDSSPITTTLADGSFQGTITQSGNSISANTQGNTASNAIGFATGINVAGNAATTNLSLAFGNSTITANAAGDLVLMNVQGNQSGTSFGSAVTGASDIAVIADAVSVAGSTITLGSDHVVASTGGNAASNTVSADGSSFSGHVAVGNQQTNNAVGMTASDQR